MSFFDDKQEIIKVELTTYGRYLISRGKFKPAYYAFFDDDVLYDGDCASLHEQQNDIETRILEQTVNLKPQTTFTSVENVIKLNSLAQLDLEKLKTEEQQISADKNYALSLPLANSALNSDYLPSWALRVVGGKISASSQILDNSSGRIETLQTFSKHPQIDLENNIYDIKRKKNDSSTIQDYNIINVFDTGSDSYFYSMKDSPIILDLRENNVDDLLKNFDIELFIENTEIIPGTNQQKTAWKQLNFKKEAVSIKNGILLDEPVIFDIIENEGSVEYYFELTVDDEIELPPQDKAMIGGANYNLSGSKPPYGVDC